MFLKEVVVVMSRSRLALSSFAFAFAFALSAPAGAVSSGIFGASGVQGFNCSSCHGGGGVSTASFLLTPVNSELPPVGAGYVPGATYDVTVSVTGGPGVKYGFNWFAGDPTTEPTPTPLGEGILTDAVNTKQRSGQPTDPEFTHTSAGNAFSSWSFRWKAPSAAGSVRIWLSGNSVNGAQGSNGDAPSPAVSLDLDPIAPEVLVRFGNVNGDIDNLVSVLRLNGSVGNDDRIEGVTVGGGLELSLSTYPGAPGTIDYALYALLKENDAGDITPVPMGVGDAAFCFIQPDTKPLVRAVANRLGHKALLGCGRFNLPSGPGILINTNVPPTVAGRKVTFLALVPDSTTASGVALSNAVVMDVP